MKYQQFTKNTYESGYVSQFDSSTYDYICWKKELSWYAIFSIPVVLSDPTGFSFGKILMAMFVVRVFANKYAVDILERIFRYLTIMLILCILPGQLEYAVPLFYLVIAACYCGRQWLRQIGEIE